MQFSDRSPRVQNLFIGPNVYLQDNREPYISPQQRIKTSGHKHNATQIVPQQIHISNPVSTTLSPTQSSINFNMPKQTNNQSQTKMFSLSASTTQFKKFTECSHGIDSYSFIQKALDNLREQKCHTQMSGHTSLFKQIEESSATKRNAQQSNSKRLESSDGKQKNINKIKLLESDNFQLKSKINKLEEQIRNKQTKDELMDKQIKTSFIEKGNITQLEDKIQKQNLKIQRIEEERNQLIVQNKKLLEVLNVKNDELLKIKDFPDNVQFNSHLARVENWGDFLLDQNKLLSQSLNSKNNELKYLKEQLDGQKFLNRKLQKQITQFQVQQQQKQKRQYDDTEILQQKVLKLEEELYFLKDQAMKNFSMVSMNTKKNLVVESPNNSLQSRLSEYESSLTPQDLARIKLIAQQQK